MLSTQSIKSTYSREVGDVSREKSVTAKPFAPPKLANPFLLLPHTQKISQCHWGYPTHKIPITRCSDASIKKYARQHLLGWDSTP